MNDAYHPKLKVHDFSSCFLIDLQFKKNIYPEVVV